MIKPVNPRHHIVTYMPFELLMFLIKKKVLSQWLNNIIKHNKKKYTAPEIIKLLKNKYYFRNNIRIFFIWLETPEGIDFWDEIDNEWLKLQNAKLWK